MTWQPILGASLTYSPWNLKSGGRVGSCVSVQTSFFFSTFFSPPFLAPAFLSPPAWTKAPRDASPNRVASAKAPTMILRFEAIDSSRCVLSSWCRMDYRLVFRRHNLFMDSRIVLDIRLQL